MENCIKKYKENGFFIKRNLIDQNDINHILLELDKIKTDMKIPHTNIQFGYGNVINKPFSDLITNNDFVKSFLEIIKDMPIPQLKVDNIS